MILFISLIVWVILGFLGFVLIERLTDDITWNMLVLMFLLGCIAGPFSFLMMFMNAYGDNVAIKKKEKD